MEEGKVLAIDYGKRRIGLSTGDLALKVAFPQGIIENKGLGFVIESLSDFCAKNNVKTIVLGLPLDTREGVEENSMTAQVRAFAYELKKSLSNCEVKLFDEAFSSYEAEEMLHEAQKNAGKRKFYKDEFAAKIILERFFDSLEK